jgi:hypothetical protein
MSNQEIMPGRPVLGGNKRLTDPVTRHAIHGRDYKSVSLADAPLKGTPSRRRPNSEGSNLPFFIPVDPPLERGKFAQAVIDVFAVVFGLLFFVSVGLSIPVALFLLFFASF